MLRTASKNLTSICKNIVSGPQNQTISSSHSSSNNPLDLESNRIVWIDMEMTGLNVDKDSIMEIACVVTDSNLNIIAKGPDLIIHHSDSVLETMNEWCIKQHHKTGLTEACRNSSLSLKDAEDAMLNFVSKYVTEKCSPLAGNSIYMDKIFLMKYMPNLNEFLHYRVIDVSSIKEICRRWNPQLYKEAPAKEFNHRALSDILESVKEMKFYKENFFKPACNPE